MSNTFYITTPIYYPNARLHMGHAYTTTLCDIMARYHRLVGEDVYFLSGADENTEKVVQAARAAGKEPQAFLDEVIEQFQELFSQLSISHDQFIRTSDQERHWPGAQEMWRKLVASGDIYKARYRGYYCVGAESYVTEKELVGGKCPDHDEYPQEIEEENYFFRLSRYAGPIQEKIERGEMRILPESRKNEILSLIESGLEDVSFSRPAEKVSVGIPVPDDPAQVMYVWCDALTNYVSALGYGQPDDALFQKFWPADYHVVGKDILRFHAAIWPAMLLSAGLSLPRQILVHGMITSGGRKMSKSLGNVIDPIELIETYGSDAVRYYLAREISPFEDGDITREYFHEVYTANLANGIGNLAARIMKMAETHLEHPVTVSPQRDLPEDYRQAFEQSEIQRAADIVWRHISFVDERIQESEPFKLVKTDRPAAVKIIEELVAELYHIAHMLEPFLPATAEKIKHAVRENRMPETLFPRKDYHG